MEENFKHMREEAKHMKEEAKQYFNDKSEELLKEIHKKVNAEVNKFSRINYVVLQPMPFERTPTRKIKRFLYV